MILIIGGSAFNCREFLLNYKENIVIIQHSNKSKVEKENLIYYENTKEFLNSKNRKEVKIIFNFASSVNTRNNFVNNFLSSYFQLVKMYFLLRKNKIDLILNIGSMWQDISKYKFKSYIIVKNLTDWFFLKFIKKCKYISIKLGDTYGINDKRNKLVKILKSQLNNYFLSLSGNEENLVFPIHTKTLSMHLIYLSYNYEMFKNSQISIIRGYPEALTLKEFVNIFAKTHNFYNEISFGDNVGIRSLDINPKSDFCFIIKENLNNTLKLI